MTGDRRYEVEPSQSMAGWALACALVPCFQPITSFVAIGLAIAVLVKSQDGRNHGRGKATAALVIAPLWVIGMVAYVVLGALSEAVDDPIGRDESGTVVESADIGTEDLRTGDCLDFPELSAEPAEDVTGREVTARPCVESHDFETVHVVDLPWSTFRGEDATIAAADRACRIGFKAYVGIDFERSKLDMSYLYPNERTWNAYGDRSVTCLVGRRGDKTTGSLKGSRR